MTRNPDKNTPVEQTGSLRHGVALRAAVESADKLYQLGKTEVQSGDWIFVKTVNSVYRMHVLGDGWYKVSGGWFDRKGPTPAKVRIAGCSWGGSIIKTGLVAACGLYLEFSNRLVTTPIQKIFLIRSWYAN